MDIGSENANTYRGLPIKDIIIVFYLIELLLCVRYCGSKCFTCITLFTTFLFLFAILTRLQTSTSAFPLFPQVYFPNILDSFLPQDIGTCCFTFLQNSSVTSWNGWILLIVQVSAKMSPPREAFLHHPIKNRSHLDITPSHFLFFFSHLFFFFNYI